MGTTTTLAWPCSPGPNVSWVWQTGTPLAVCTGTRWARLGQAGPPTRVTARAQRLWVGAVADHVVQPYDSVCMGLGLVKEV